MPRDKLVVGVPFYGRGWHGVKDVNRGLYQPHGPGLPKGTWENGVFDYRDLAEVFPSFWQSEFAVKTAMNAPAS